MTQTIQSHDPASTLLADAVRLAPMLQTRAEEFENARRLPADAAAALAEAGFMRMLVPAYAGGLEVEPHVFMAALETLAEGDASASWCAMIGATTGLAAAYMPEQTAQELFADPATITGGVFAPLGKAEDRGDHYLLTGRWAWGSGSANARWLGGGAMILRDGQPAQAPGGGPYHRMMFFPAAEAELIDTWHTAGLKGTGSGDFAVAGVRVPKERTTSLQHDAPVADGPLYVFPAFGLLALGVASVALGNGFAALEAVKDLAGAKKAQFSSRVLAERPVVQSRLAETEAALRGARAFLTEALDACWELACEEGTLSLEARAELRLACTYATRTAADAARTAYDIGGGAALYLESELQRRFRDAHAATQHIMTAPATYEVCGRALLGQPVDAGML